MESASVFSMRESAGYAWGQSQSHSHFCLAELAGRLVELSGSSASTSLTLAFRLVLDAQEQREPVAWITTDASSFYPPDVAEGGVDLGALTVVRMTESDALPRAADRLARSGAFGLIVMDWGKRRDASIPMPLQTRLVGLAQKHHTLILCLTEKSVSTPSLSSLVSMRAYTRRVRVGSDRFQCEVDVVKDKRHGPTWSYKEVCHGSVGLR